MVKKSTASPWLTIWTQPRVTIRRIVNTNPNYGLWWLALIYGFSSLLGTFQSISMGSSMGVIAIALIGLVLAPIWGFIVFSIWGAFAFLTGKILKGEGRFQTVRAAFTWSNVPMIVNDLIWIVMLAMFGAALFTQGDHTAIQGAGVVLLVFMFIRVVLTVWSIVICVNALAEVQGFSILRAIGNLVLAFILLVIVLAILSFIGMHLMGNPSQQTATLMIKGMGL